MRQFAIGAVSIIFLGGTVAVQAADMATPVFKSNPVVAATYDWTGFYVGGHVSYGWRNTDATSIDTVTGAVVATDSSSASAFHGGGQVGYDLMMPSHYVVGILADVTSGSSDTNTFSNAAGTNVHSTEGKTDVSGTVRGRLGYAFDRVMAYGTGGWAWSTGSELRTQLVGTTGLATPGTAESVSVHHNGWTVGPGAAWALSPNWNVFLEYRYTRFEATTVTFPIAQRSTNSTTTANNVELGVSYKF
ncbi:MAG: outer membrane protein [Xanthobacteraceae bacterium]